MLSVSLSVPSILARYSKFIDEAVIVGGLTQTHTHKLSRIYTRIPYYLFAKHNVPNDEALEAVLVQTVVAEINGSAAIIVHLDSHTICQRRSWQVTQMELDESSSADHVTPA